MKVKDKNFGIETPAETVYFKMVGITVIAGRLGGCGAGSSNL